MKVISKYLVIVTMYTTPHYFISSFIATLMVCLHGGFVSEEDFKQLADHVTNEIVESNLFTKIVIITIWYGIYFALFNKYCYESY